jgi:primosomal replication protein N
VTSTGSISRRSVLKASPEGVRRLAKYLRLHTEGMSDRQIKRLVWWRIKPRREWG